LVSDRIAHKEKFMKKKILIASVACVTLIAIAVAQSSDAKPQSASGKETPAREVTSGHASGKSASKPAGSQAQLSDPNAAAVTAPRDQATGQASGKRQYQPVIIRKVSDDEAATTREQQSPKATGKTSAHDDWHAAAKTTTDANHDGATASGQVRVAAGDVTGDGKADVSASSNSDVKGPRDLATGQASGKRQHQPVTPTKEVAPASPQK
jgi:hypothetical protein